MKAVLVAFAPLAALGYDIGCATIQHARGCKCRLGLSRLCVVMQVVKMLRFNGTKVPPDYEIRFQLALWAFRHARVYCTSQKVRNGY